MIKAQEHFRAKATENQPLQHALTDHTSAIQMKKGTEAPASSAATEPHTSVSVATERANVEFSIEGAMAEALHRIKSVDGHIEILARIVDHACHSENCISHRVAAMCREANWQTCAELYNNQPLDACGYIAADAVCRLRSAALAELNGWHGIGLPDYSHLECIHRGNQILNMRSDDRILNSDQVNRLVRHYSQLDQSQRAAEEWWGGAIAIDHFLTGLPDSIQEISTSMSDKQHRWRAWVVNTQSSTQPGSHWFTVVMGAKMELLQSTHEHRLSASSSQPLATISQLLQSTAEDPSISISPHFAIHATAAPNQSPELPDDTPAATAATANSSTEHGPTEANPNNYPYLFISPEPALSNALRWAHANAMQPPVAAWLHACDEWDAAVRKREHHRRTKRRKLCKDHDIPCGVAQKHKPIPREEGGVNPKVYPEILGIPWGYPWEVQMSSKSIKMLKFQKTSLSRDPTGVNRPRRIRI